MPHCFFVNLTAEASFAYYSGSAGGGGGGGGGGSGIYSIPEKNSPKYPKFIQIFPKLK